jgi:hypothetical protein
MRSCHSRHPAAFCALNLAFRRNALGKTALRLRGREGTVAVSRQYAHLFKQM